MGLFGGNESKSVLLVDVSSSSARAAYASVRGKGPVVLHHAVRVPMEIGDEAASTATMLRTLDATLRELRDKGAPILHKRTGSGSVSAAYVTVGGPWQDAGIRIETVGDGKPFTFGAELLDRAKKNGEVPKGRIRSEESVLATILNGYETTEPVGKRAKSAEIVILTATIDEEAASMMRKAVGSFTDHKDVRFATFASLIHESVAGLFPHEKDYLGLRVSGEASELLFVKHGTPLASVSIPCGLNEFSRAAQKFGMTGFPGDDAIDHAAIPGLQEEMAAANKKWAGAIAGCLKDFTAAHALPRTLFLVTDPEARAFIHKALDVPDIHALWLSDDPLSVITLEPSHFSSAVGGEPGATDEVQINMLALVARHRLSR